MLHIITCMSTYHKIPKISPGAYFWRGLYIWTGLSRERNSCFKINWASLIVGSKFTVFVLFFFVFEGNFPSTSPQRLVFRGAI